MPHWEVMTSWLVSCVDSMYMTTEGMEVQLCQRYEGQLNYMAESTPPPPIRSLSPYHDTHHYSTVDGRAKTDRLD